MRTLLKPLWKLRNAIAEMCDPIEGLLEQKKIWGTQRVESPNGEFDDNDAALTDAEEELEFINAELVRRQRSA